MNEIDPMTCSYCGGKATVLDHVTPRCLNGLHHPLNLTPSCTACNSSKGGRPLAEWLLSHLFGVRPRDDRRRAIKRRLQSGELADALPVGHGEMLQQALLEAAWQRIKNHLIEAHEDICDANHYFGVQWMQRAGACMAAGAYEPGDEEE